MFIFTNCTYIVFLHFWIKVYTEKKHIVLNLELKYFVFEMENSIKEHLCVMFFGNSSKKQRNIKWNDLVRTSTKGYLSLVNFYPKSTSENHMSWTFSQLFELNVWWINIKLVESIPFLEFYKKGLCLRIVFHFQNSIERNQCFDNCRALFINLY